MTDDEPRAIAEAATSGPWTVAEPGYGWDHFAAILNADGIVATCHIAALSREHSETAATARHIATFDPPTILALLDRLAAAEARLAVLEGALDRLEAANNALCAKRSTATYHSMIMGDGAQPELKELDDARRRARAALAEGDDA